MVNADASAQPQGLAEQLEWYAAHTCSRQEKVAAEHLKARSVEHFLPLYETVHRWKDRNMRLYLPLFPGYVFVRISPNERLKVLQSAGIARLVSFGGRPAPLPESEIENVRKCLTQRVSATPHTYLRIGRRVRVTAGPLEGLEGIVVRHRGNLRVIVSIDTIMRSIAVDVEAWQLEPI